MYKYFDQIFSKHGCGFHQGYTTQHRLLVMVKKWKEVLDKDGSGGVLLTNGDFDSIKH